MEDSSIEAKQHFLRENIINKGIEPKKFVDFLKEKTGEESNDIVNWTMDDLKNLEIN